MELIKTALQACRTLETCPEPVQAANFAEVLQFWAERQPDEFAYAYLGFGRQPDLVMTYGAMHRRALAIAHEIVARGRPGDPVLLVFPSALGFIEAFFACLYAGRMAVPALPPRSEREARRLTGITRDCRPVLMLTNRAELEAAVTHLQDQVGWAPPSLAVEDVPDRADAPQLPVVAPDAIAFLQYTSGSTSEPKGVMVGHGNLLHNEMALRRQFKTDRDRWLMVSWLPHYHDMGLIGGILLPLFAGRPGVFMSPQDFLQQPGRWLQAISTFGGTVSGAPNSAYDICVRRAPRMKLETLDLSSWNHAFNGSEPVHLESLQQFAETFASTGFRLDSFAPCYGLAELTLLGTTKNRDDRVICRSVDTHALAAGHLQASQSTDAWSVLVSVGQPAESAHVFRIIDPATGEFLPDGRIGEICVAGASVCRGYFGRQDISESTFHSYRSAAFPEGFLRTGDLGVIDENGELFICGRIKDLIILNGANQYPQDLEQLIRSEFASVRPNRIAAFLTEGQGGAGVVIAFETNGGEDLATVGPIMAERLWSACQVTPAALLRVAKGSIPLTSSGKIQRSATRQMLLAGALPVEDAYLTVPDDSWIGTLVAQTRLGVDATC